MAYGEKLLFYDVNLILNEKNHYALVGANGTGKSTFFKLLTGEEEQISGSVSIAKDATVGWLKQDQFRYEETLLTDIVIQGKPKLWEAMVEKEKLLASTHWDEKLANKLSHLENEIAHLDGYSAHAFAEKLLLGLGISANYHQKPLSALSGGFKLRVLLAQALFQEPNILLLDEPTNHLDVLSIQWLEKYLKNEFKGLLIFISHDIEFINRLADNILDVDYGEIRQYSGNYAKFLNEKAAIELQKIQLKKQAEQKIAEMQRFVDRFKAKASKARQAQSRMKMIEKIEIPDVEKSSRLTPIFHFRVERSSPKKVLQVRGLAKQFAERKLFSNIHFEVARGEKIAIMGENGIGKSTLIKILMNQLYSDEGSFEWGNEVKISYFSQDHHELLRERMEVLTWLSDHVSNQNESQIRKVLGQVCFRKDDVKKNILSLSGGEAARLLLAYLILETGNVLVLDEPTNHLDIETVEALAESLKNFPGTVIFVSHDRHFISKVANRILFISHRHGLQDLRGNLTEVEKLIIN